ncbi:putative ubiquinone biosynthesis monooxygenase [Mycoemilia scoparia]|uniref:Ubiquinone biosynthesis monooxygenase n=1 Tax=Mycoemilia scoparia TaxID=417184 RepID=A0A9W8DQ04_9FUNG|nr:putative ubiquinone biosynthesis monooxygenase [Mycoemilia scoparia]
MYINKTSILKGYHFLPNPLYRTFSTGGIRKKHKLYDIAIIGGGPTGNAMACALTSSPELSNKKIALIDPGKYDHVAAWEPPLNAYSNRTLQITSSSHKFLQGLWNYVMQERTQPYYRAFISDSVEGGRVILEPNTKTAGPVAYLVETKNLQRAFVRMLNDQKDKIDIIDRTKVTSISTEPGDLDWPIVHLSNSSTIQARLLIGADGYYSSVRKYSSIYSQTYDYQQHGLVANLILERTNQDAYERFLPSGPIALLPFPNAQANIVWSLTRDIVQKLKNLPEDLFVKMVNAAFALPSSDVEYLVDLIDQDGSCIDSQVDVEKEINWRWKIATKNSTLCENQPPRISSITPKSRTTFPLRMLNADRYIGERLALIGVSYFV